jgi:FAD/FMN-containing dehydrogenase
MDQKKARLVEIVGTAGVVDSPGLGESFSLDRHLISPEPPSFLVKPSNVDQVQRIVLWANETGTPLVPSSSGPPHLRGGTLPTAPGAVVVDLSGMKRILKINRRNRLAVIEPGVTYSELQPELQREGLRIITPLLPRSTKSVIASLLERDAIISPRYQWTLLEPLRSLEIVWGNGEKFYSGTGFLWSERDEDWDEGQVPLQGPGPAQLDYYRLVSGAQGGMGIVTWASVKCEVFAERRRLFLVPAKKLESLIDLAYRLLRSRFGDELFIVNNACLAYLLSAAGRDVESRRAALPPWTLVVGVTGGNVLPDVKVARRESDMRQMAEAGGLDIRAALDGCDGDALLELLLKPSAEPYWKVRYRGASQELFFMTTLDRTPGYVSTVASAAAERSYPDADLGVYIQPAQQGVCCHCEFILPFDRGSPDEVKRTLAVFRDASKRLFEQRAYFSRPYGMWASMVYEADPRTTAVTRKMKGIFDPNQVMNPGKLCF